MWSRDCRTRAREVRQRQRRRPSALHCSELGRRSFYDLRVRGACGRYAGDYIEPRLKKAVPSRFERPARERPRRRGRPPIISDDRLLEAAREVFLARGIRATTAEVAERAGVSEGTIFHRYKTKDALFRAAMQFDPEEVPKIIEALTPRAGEGDLRETLEALALRVLSFGRVAIPMMMMAWSNPNSEYSLEQLLISKQLGHERPLRFLEAFFAAEIERGRLARVNAQVLTRMFMGTLRDFCLGAIFANNEARMEPQELARQVVDLILRAARPETPNVSPARAVVPARPRVRARSR